MKPIDATNEKFSLVKLFGKPALFTSLRLDRKTIPAGLYTYDIRHADGDGFEAAGVKPFVMVNHMGAVIMKENLEFEQIDNTVFDTVIDDGDFSFLPFDGLTLRDFMDGNYETVIGEYDQNEDAGMQLHEGGITIMKQENNPPPRAAVYMRVGSIQQMFKSNADMVRHLFKEILNDGQEHSYRDIKDTILDKTNVRGVDGNRLTDEMIHSAIWYMFRHDKDFRYAQTRKGYYQKNSAESLLGDGKTGLRQFALQALDEAKEKIRLHAAVPGMSEQEQNDVTRLLQNITGAVDQAYARIDSNSAWITADDLEITDDLYPDGDRITAYFNAWFDVDQRLGTQTEGTDAHITLCTNYYPDDDNLSVYYILHDTDGAERDPVSVPNLTDNEQDAILAKMREAGLDECLANMQGDPDDSEGIQMG